MNSGITNNLRSCMENNKYQYLLSVIIPTKNRLQYLRVCLDAFLPMVMDENTIEVIIHDNSDDIVEYNQIKKDYEASNILFYHSDEHLSQTGNSEKALELVRGKYVSYIGDDDIITISLIELARLLDKNEIDACIFDTAHYIWPDAIRNNPELIPYYFNSQPIKILEIDPRAELIKELRNGMQIIDRLPRVYHGIVTSRVLNCIKEKCGHFFPGPSPDMANAVSVALTLKKSYYISAPFVVDGRAFNSASGMGLRGQHYAKIGEVKQLAPNVEKEWDKRIPQIWMGETIWPESALKALKAMNESSYIKHMNFGRIYITVLKRGRQNWRYVKPFIWQFKNIIPIVTALGTVAKKRVAEKIFHSNRRVTKIEKRDIDSLDKARKITDEYLTQENVLKCVEEFFDNNG